MAVEAVTGARVAWHCEFDPAPSSILAHHWPDVPNLRDVTTVDWSEVEPVDILTGGYPCQPFSQAGQRKGTTDERHLWPYVREAIRHLRPRFTFLENVAGHRSLGFDSVLADLAEDGLHVRWTSIRASDIGAPHHRERLFILAAPADTGGTAVGEHPGESPAEETGPEGSHGPGDTRGERPAQIGREGTADPRGLGLEAGRSPRRPEAEVAGDHNRFSSFSNPNGKRRDGRGVAPEQECRAHEPTDIHRSGIDWGPYTGAVQQWERLTRLAPAPTEPNSKGNPRLNAAFAEWMMGLPEGHVTGVPSLSRANQLKAIGNGVCPAQAAAALTQLLTPPR